MSMLDAEGQPFHDPGADRALFDELARHAGSGVPVHELDLHINDEAFAYAMADELLTRLTS